MFHTLDADTADEAWREVMSWFSVGGRAIQQSGRGGATSEVLHAGISLRCPKQRWISSRSPALNPAFAIAEVVWMVNGRCDSEFLNFFNRRLPQYAGTDAEYYGAYGKRMRISFGFDQLESCFHALKENPDSRQVVLQIWDPQKDMPNRDGSPRAQDVPCNITSLLKVREGLLEWTQIMRSNDVVLGLPHNIVQFTSLQEIVAGWLNLGVGSYHHFSDSLHLYGKYGDGSGVNSCSPPPANTDSLSLARDDSMRAFANLSDFVLAIIRGAKAREILHQLAALNIDSAHRNLGSILAADALRRLNDPHACREAISICANPCLRFMFDRWCERQNFDC